MEVLSNRELENINGGSKTILIVLGGLVIFALGIFCGFFEKQIRRLNMKLENRDLANVVGGAITASFLTAVLNIGKTIFDIGCQIGKNIRKLIFG